MKAREGYNKISEEQTHVIMSMFWKQIERELNLDSSRDHFLDEETFKLVENAKQQKKFFLDNRNNLKEIMMTSVGYENIEQKL